MYCRTGSDAGGDDSSVVIVMMVAVYLQAGGTAVLWLTVSMACRLTHDPAMQAEAGSSVQQQQGRQGKTASTVHLASMTHHNILDVH